MLPYGPPRLDVNTGGIHTHFSLADLRSTMCVCLATNNAELIIISSVFAVVQHCTASSPDVHTLNPPPLRSARAETLQRGVGDGVLGLP